MLNKLEIFNELLLCFVLQDLPVMHLIREIDIRDGGKMLNFFKVIKKGCLRNAITFCYFSI
jgi:hypothetical protein